MITGLYTILLAVSCLLVFNLVKNVNYTRGGNL